MGVPAANLVEVLVLLPVLQTHVLRLGVCHPGQQQRDVAEPPVRPDPDELGAHRGGPLAERTGLLVLGALAGQWHRAKPECVAHSSGAPFFFPPPLPLFLLKTCPLAPPFHEKRDPPE